MNIGERSMWNKFLELIGIRKKKRELRVDGCTFERPGSFVYVSPRPSRASTARVQNISATKQTRASDTAPDPLTTMLWANALSSHDHAKTQSDMPPSPIHAFTSGGGGDYGGGGASGSWEAPSPSPSPSYDSSSSDSSSYSSDSGSSSSFSSD